MLENVRPHPGHRYSVGPLYDDAEYEAVASKPGFQFRQFTPDDKWSFEGLKLGQIVVEIGPGSGAEQPLPSVVLSLSGDQRYQKNAATGEGGSLTFEELFPGTFYLKPLLKVSVTVGIWAFGIQAVCVQLDTRYAVWAPRLHLSSFYQFFAPVLLHHFLCSLDCR